MKSSLPSHLFTYSSKAAYCPKGTLVPMLAIVKLIISGAVPDAKPVLSLVSKSSPYPASWYSISILGCFDIYSLIRFSQYSFFSGSVPTLKKVSFVFSFSDLPAVPTVLPALVVLLALLLPLSVPVPQATSEQARESESNVLIIFLNFIRFPFLILSIFLLKLFCY